MSYARKQLQRYRAGLENASVKLADHSASEATEFDRTRMFGYGNTGLVLGTQSIENRDMEQHFRHWTYVAISTIAGRCAQQHWNAGQNVGAMSNERISQRRAATKNAGRYKLRDRKYNRRMLTRRDVEMGKIPRHLQRFKGHDENPNIELIENHEAVDLLSNPNPLQTGSEFVDMIVSNLYLSGAAYIIGGEVGEGEASGNLELWAIPYNWMIPQHNGGIFTNYLFIPPGFGGSVGEIIPAEKVCRIYNPNPADLRREQSPAVAQLEAIEVDGMLQRSQREGFAQGIWPNVLVEIGRHVDGEGNVVEQRPILNGDERLRLQRAIRHVWKTDTGNGDPGIIDGLIEKVHKLNQSPQEMDWMNSGQQIKDRIFQSMKVNPYIVGETTGINKAQAVVAERNFANQTTNPVLAKISEAVTGFIGSWWTEPERLELWLEPVRVVDEDVRTKKWNAARDRGDVSTNDYRTNELHLPPLDEPEADETCSKLLDNPQTMTTVMNIVKEMNMGTLSEDQAIGILKPFLRISEDGVRKMLADAPAIVPVTTPDAGGDATNGETREDTPENEIGSENAGAEPENSQETDDSGELGADEKKNGQTAGSRVIVVSTDPYFRTA